MKSSKPIAVLRLLYHSLFTNAVTESLKNKIGIRYLFLQNLAASGNQKSVSIPFICYMRDGLKIFHRHAGNIFGYHFICGRLHGIAKSVIPLSTLFTLPRCSGFFI